MEKEERKINKMKTLATFFKINNRKKKNAKRKIMPGKCILNFILGLLKSKRVGISANPLYLLTH